MAFLLYACGGGGGGGGGGSPPPPKAPNAPAWVKAVAENGEIVIGWMPVGNANDPVTYNLYWSTTASAATKASLDKATNVTNPHKLSGLPANTTYYFVVTAVNSIGESSESPVTNAATTSPPLTDPLYTVDSTAGLNPQWHLRNDYLAGEDINVESAWLATCGVSAVACKGDGVRVAVVDDGLEMGHEDLLFNVVPGAGHDYLLLNGTDPTPVDRSNTHGTEVAGVIAARDRNGLGGRGVAPRASIFGYNLIAQGGIDTVSETDAMTRDVTNVHVSNNSWGSPDGTAQLNPSNATWRSAIDSGINAGRGGKGTVYVWAAGNGKGGSDNSNYDGQSNYRGVIAVGAVLENGVATSYSEPGANVWVSAPAGDFCSNSHTIVTTDLMGPDGKNNAGTNIEYGLGSDLADSNYTKCFNGTSAATPVVSGVVALMLQANPTLTWRDVRLILAQTARVNDPTSNNTTSPDGIGWQGAVYLHHHSYGFGVVDAGAAITLAQTWSNVGPELAPCVVSRAPGVAIPDNNPNNPAIDNATLSGCNINKIEFVEVTFSSNHSYSGDLTIMLVSPTNTISLLAETHTCTDGGSTPQAVACTGYSGWVFGSAVHLGEAANGNWSLVVADGTPGDTGNITSWSLKIHGRAN